MCIHLLTGYYRNNVFAVCIGVAPLVMPLIYGQSNSLQDFHLQFFLTVFFVLFSLVLGLMIGRKATEIESRYRQRLGATRLHIMDPVERESHLHPSLEHMRGV